MKDLGKARKIFGMDIQQISAHKVVGVSNDYVEKVLNKFSDMAMPSHNDINKLSQRLITQNRNQKFQDQVKILIKNFFDQYKNQDKM